jgi:hypothetical protein
MAIFLVLQQHRSLSPGARPVPPTRVSDDLPGPFFSHLVHWAKQSLTVQDPD